MSYECSLANPESGKSEAMANSACTVLSVQFSVFILEIAE